jgi:putative hydroxymethylpyrimidine transport system substrate-binding protein
MRRPVLATLAALLAATGLAACGEKTEPTAGGGGRQLEPFTVMLDYLPNADHAGIYLAQADGEFERAGLKVKIMVPPDPSAPLKYLRAGRVDLAVSYEPEILLARDKGQRLLSVGALVQKPLTTLMAIKGSKVGSVDDLAGKTVGTAGIPYQDAYLKTILKKAGLQSSEVKTVDVGYNLVPAMIAKKVDATLGAFWNVEGVDLQQQGRKPVVMRMDELGVPRYNELILVARAKDLNPAGASRMRRFLQATAAGHRLVKDDPSFGVNALRAADSSLDPKLLDAQIRATLPAFFPAGAKQPWGWQEPVEWATYERWMRANRLLTRPPSDAPPLTNEFLPGESVGGSESG